MKKSNLTGAVASVKGKDLLTDAAVNVTDVISGRIAGVSVDRSSGKPGGGSVIRIRGVGTLNNNDPLVIIDGLPGSINAVSPKDIESVEVLKDASSAAIYGTRAANGVILITTKSGISGETRIDVNVTTGFERLINTPDLMDGQEYVDFDTKGRTEAGIAIPVRHENGFDGRETDWVDLMFRNALLQDYSVGIRTGTEDSKLSFLVGHTHNQGTYLSTDYKRYSFKIKSEMNKGIFSIGESIIFNVLDNDLEKNLDSYTFDQVWKIWPTMNPYDEDGNYEVMSPDEPNYRNPYANAMEYTNRNSQYNLFSSLWATVDLTKGLQFKTNVGASIDHSYSMWHIPIIITGNIHYDKAQMQEVALRRMNLINENTLTYKKQFGNHFVNVLVGNTVQDNMSRSVGGMVSNFPDNNIKVLGAGTESSIPIGVEFNSKLLSYFGRVNYSFGNRYLLSATVRRDGSSKFSSDNRWAVFPSVAVAWKISEEEFMSGVDNLNHFKLKASYGTLGNQAIADYQYMSTIMPHSNYLLGSGETYILGSTSQSFASENIKWETTTSMNIGLEAVLFNKLDVNIDYYNKI